VFDQVGRRLHQRETLGIDEVVRLRRQRTADGDDVRLPEDVLETHEFDAELRRDVLVCEGVVGDEAHVEGFGHAERLRPDIAMPIEPSARPRGRTPIWSERLAKPAADSRANRSLTISLPVRASISVMIDIATGRRTPSGVMRERCPRWCRRRTSTCRSPTPKRATTARRPLLGTLGRREAVGEQDQRVEILKLVAP